MQQLTCQQQIERTLFNCTHRRRGAILVLVVLMLVIFLAAVAFSVDVAYMELSRTQLRIATDAAARAAGEALTRLQDVSAAREAAKECAAANLVAGDPLLLADEDVIFGTSRRQNDGGWEFTPNGNPINSIRIVGRRTNDSPSKSIRLFFGPVFNVYDFQPTMFSTVIRTDRDICLVLDRSSSMKLGLQSDDEVMQTSDVRFCQPPYSVDSRWAVLTGAIQIFTQELASTPQVEHVSLVSFASNYTSCGNVNQASSINQAMTSNTGLVNQAMQTISNSVFNGATNIAAGIDTGVGVLTNPATARPFAFKTLVLFTDGHYTTGRQPLLAAQDAAQQGIIIHTVTFGLGSNDPEMEAVAKATGGKSYHATDPGQLAPIFREIARSVSVTLID